MTRIVCMFLALLMLFSLFSVAEADSPAFVIDEIRPDKYGLTVTWSDPNGNAPYKVLFQPVTEANEDKMTGDMIVWSNSGEINETEYLEYNTVSTNSWWFCVEDSAGNQVFKKYEGKESDFEDAIMFECQGHLQKAKKGMATIYYDDVGKPGLVSFKVQDIISAPDNEYYGIRLNISVKSWGNYRGTMMLKYVLVGPPVTGYIQANTPIVAGYMWDTSSPLHFSDDHRSNSIFVNLSGVVKNLYRISEDFRGPFELQIYVNGMYAWSIPIMVF